MKRTLMKTLVLLSLLLISVGSTFAYLTDTQQAVNVATLGDVKIELIEQERDGNGNLVPFQDNHMLIPAVIKGDLGTDPDTGFWTNIRNSMDKVVTVKNTGNTAAYVELWFAFEVTDADIGPNADDDLLMMNQNYAHWDWLWLDDYNGTASVFELDGSRYHVAAVIYPEPLAPGETTPVCLWEVALSSHATAADLAQLGEKYSIFVVAQAVQADGFDSAYEALTAGFGEKDADHLPFEGMTANDPGNNGGQAAYPIYPAEKIDWYTGGIQQLIPYGANFKIYDMKTGIVWWAHRWAGSNHAEIEPLTQADTERLCDIYDVDNPQEIVDKNLYQRRPCLVTVENRTFACSLYGVPHNPDADTIANNGMDGVLCLFFTNSTSHADSVDASHEEAIEYAYQNAPNGQKTAESLGYVQITQNSVNLRTRPTSGQVVTRLGIGTVWPIIGPSQESGGYTWYNIKADDYIGYVRGDCAVELTKEQAEIFEQTGVTPSLPGEKPDNEAHVCNYQPTDEYIEVDEESHRRIWVCTGCNGEPEFKYEIHTYDNTGKCVCGATTSSSNETPVEHFRWKKTVDGTGIIIHEYLGSASDVRIPATIDGLPVKELGSGVFWDRYLTNIVLPDSLETLGNQVFSYCRGLTSINIPASVTSISHNTFVMCNSLTTIQVDPNNSVYCSQDGALFSKNGKTLLFYPNGQTGTYTIPEGVECIGKAAFSDSQLFNLYIPDSVTTICDYAFTDCDNLTTLTIPQSVTSFGNWLFRYSSGLQSVTILANIESIGESMFEGCNYLNSITLPTSVKSIGAYAFRQCNYLSNITIPDGVNSISYEAFSYCTNLESITIPDSVNSIGYNAFVGCDKLTVYGATEYVENWCAENGVTYKPLS